MLYLLERKKKNSSVELRKKEKSRAALTREKKSKKMVAKELSTGTCQTHATFNRGEKREE